MNVVMPLQRANWQSRQTATNGLSAIWKRQAEHPKAAEECRRSAAATVGLVHVWSTSPSEPSGSQRSPAVSSGRSLAQVAGAILRKQARGQNPDKDGAGHLWGRPGQWRQASLEIVRRGIDRVQLRSSREGRGLAYLGCNFAQGRCVRTGGGGKAGRLSKGEHPRAGSDTTVTGKPAHPPPRAIRTLAAGQAVRTSEAAGSRRVPVALSPGRLADLPVAIPASLTMILEPVLGTPTTPRPPHPPKRRPDPVQHGSPSSLFCDPLSSSADTGTRSRGAGPSRLAARTPWGRIGPTSSRASRTTPVMSGRPTSQVSSSLRSASQVL